MKAAVLRITILLGLITMLVSIATASAATPGRLSVFFLRGEQLASVQRPGTTALDAMRQLVAGPTPAEVREGFRTYLPRATRVLSVKVANGVATVDLDQHFAAGRDPASLLARLAEVVRTLTGPQGATSVQLLMNGAVIAARFPGISMSRPITYRLLQTPNVAVPKAPALRLPAPDPAVKEVQQRLIDLGYLLPGDADGRFGPSTQNAILSFQKWERLAVSTGKPSTPTPPGDYHVYAKIPRWWSTPFREWLPWALPFVGGIAFHELANVPAYPASHGCVRQSYTVARWTYNFAFVGMPVKVLASS
jgi:lipoprotein-anchoring transpeptidase ErfK/SrfK